MAKGRIIDPPCDSNSALVQLAYGENLIGISIYGQESNLATGRMAAMKLAQLGINAEFGSEYAHTFRGYLHTDLRADYIPNNPLFNDSDWPRRDDNMRSIFGVFPAGTDRFIHPFAPHAFAPHGMGCFNHANRRKTSNH
jgi:type I restriction enzyme M protein